MPSKPEIKEFDLEKEVQAAQGWYLIREEDEPTGFTILTPDQSKDQAQFGTVISVGAAAFKDGTFIEPEAKVGDLVYYEKWKGVELERGRGKERLKYKLIEFARLAGIINLKK